MIELQIIIRNNNNVNVKSRKPKWTSRAERASPGHDATAFSKKLY